MGSRERYYWLKEHGICVNCGQQDAEPHKTLCFECANKINMKAQFRYHSKKQKDSRAAYNRQHRRDLLNAGKCIYCGKPRSPQSSCFCLDCFLKEKRRAKERWQQTLNSRTEEEIKQIKERKMQASLRNLKKAWAATKTDIEHNAFRRDEAIRWGYIGRNPNATK